MQLFNDPHKELYRSNFRTRHLSCFSTTVSVCSSIYLQDKTLVRNTTTFDTSTCLSLNDGCFLWVKLMEIVIAYLLES